LPSKARNGFLTAAALLLLTGVADAQTADSTPPAADAPARYPIQTPQTVYRTSLSDADTQLLRQVLDASRRGDIANARVAIASLADPLARKIAAWALTDTAAESLSFFEVEKARGDLAGWPRAARRQAAAEKLLETSGMTSQRIIEWFGGAEPTTAEGAIALASALRATGKAREADVLIRRFWRDKPFEADVQRAMLARFGGVLTVDDHVRRADILLLGAQGPAARDMLLLLPPDQLALAQARMAFRANAANANDLAAVLPPGVANAPGLAFERAAYLRRRGLDGLAMAQLPNFPTDIPYADAADRIWNERYALTLTALKNGDARGAYAAASNTGLTTGADAAEAEFYAGWIALTRLKDPARADAHFANLERIGASPITRGRALYWRGRAAAAKGDATGAVGFYSAAARHNTTFYGQLAGEKVNNGKLELGHDPAITAADRARFEGRESVRAARLLYEMGDKPLFRTFVLALDDVLPTAEEEALLVDLARSYGDQDTSMKVVRSAAQRGFILPDRGYPVRTPPLVYGAAEPALVMGVTRQESGFDPLVRSGAGARGMMQLMPATAQVVARKNGMGYAPAMLDDPDYNMRLGSSFLGQLTEQFSGSYVMAIAGYNAGPGRPMQWSSFCGDPRTAATDPIDFIECIPFSETRNYVMRVMEGLQVYRAKQHGGSAPITLSSDLARGGYSYPAFAREAAATPPLAGGPSAAR